MVKVKYYIYYFDNGYVYFNHTFDDLKQTDIRSRYKTTSKLYDTFIKQKIFRPIQLLSEKDIHPRDIIPEGKRILKELNIPRDKFIWIYNKNGG